MRLAVTSNVDETMAQLQSAFSDAREVALPRALNTLRDQARTAGLRKLNDVYGVGPRIMDQYVSVTFASSTDLEATISVKGRGFPLQAFQPRQTNAGVSVSIKGKRVVIPHTFLATMKSGHVGVFARGAYGGKSERTLRSNGSFGRFEFGRGRLPINELFTFGPADAFGNDDVTNEMQDRVESQASTVVAREIKAAVRGF